MHTKFSNKRGALCVNNVMQAYIAMLFRYASMQWRWLLYPINHITWYILANTKHLYNIYTAAAQNLRRWSSIVYMLYKCFAFAGYSYHQVEYDSIFPDTIRFISIVLIRLSYVLKCVFVSWTPHRYGKRPIDVRPVSR